MSKKGVNPIRTSQQSALALAVAISFVLYFIPFGYLLLAPILFYNTIIHEISHAIAALVTGGQVKYILINSDTSGMAVVSGGWMLFIASAGYLGAALFGALCIVFSKTADSARIVLMAQAALLTLCLLIWIRGDAIGIAVTILWIVALAMAGWFTKGNFSVFLAQFLGVQQCLASILVLGALVPGTQMGEYLNDAQVVSDITGIPAIVFAVTWMVTALALGYLALARVWTLPPWRRQSKPASAGRGPSGRS
jgi:hypothetical protein